jgi:hypothetical protein
MDGDAVERYVEHDPGRRVHTQPTRTSYGATASVATEPLATRAVASKTARLTAR